MRENVATDPSLSLPLAPVSRFPCLTKQTILTTTVTVTDRRITMRHSNQTFQMMEKKDHETGFYQRSFYPLEASLALDGTPANDTPPPSLMSPASDTQPVTLTSPANTEAIEDLLPKLQSFVRQLWPDDPRICHASVSFIVKTTRLEMVASQESRESIDTTTLSSKSKVADETQASLTIEWQVKTPKETLYYKEEVFRAHPESLFEDPKSLQRVCRAVERSVFHKPNWPAPSGNLPVLWSSRAVAKIVQAFLQTFEGDRVLTNQSFLNSWPETIQLSFGLEESPQIAIDAEGTPTKPRTVFDGVRPKTLFVNQQLAEKMQVPPTGHCRRTSLEAAPTLAFWNARVTAKKTLCDSHTLDCGISVKDIEIVSFDPQTGNMTIRFTDSYLLHLGQEGERIEPLSFETSLLDILGSWTSFSSEEQMTGLKLVKGAQELLTEINTPDAISHRFFIPGQVPAAHYW